MTTVNAPSPAVSTRPGHNPGEDLDKLTTNSVDKPFPLARLPDELISEVFKAVICHVKFKNGGETDFSPSDSDSDIESQNIPLKARQSLTLSSISCDLRRTALSMPSLWVYLFDAMPCQIIDMFAARSGQRLLCIRIQVSNWNSLSEAIRQLWVHRARWGVICTKGDVLNGLMRTERQQAIADLAKVHTLDMSGGWSVPSLTSIFHTVPSLQKLCIKGHLLMLHTTPIKSADASIVSLNTDLIPPSLSKITLLEVTMYSDDVETLLSSLRRSSAWQNLAASKIDVTILSAGGGTPSPSFTLDKLVDECKSKIEINIRLPTPSPELGCIYTVAHTPSFDAND